MNSGIFSQNWSAPFHGFFQLPVFALLLVLLVAWSIFWKGIALWKAARRSDRSWFIALLIVNTAGILEILYLYVFSRKPKKSHQ